MLTIILEDEDPALLAVALGDIACAGGITEIAKASGLAREAKPCTRLCASVRNRASTP